MVDHPTPVHGDELEFMSAIGFPAAYPVHQPGYPLWVALGTLLSRCGASPYAAYQAWSVVFSVLAPWLLYLALRREVDDAIGWWIALAMGVCPLNWFMGTTALNYSAACAAGLIVAMTCRRAIIDHSAAHMRCAAACLAVSIQLRPDLLLWLGLMVLFTAWRFKRADRVFCLLVLAMGIAWVFGVQSWLYGRAPRGAMSRRSGIPSTSSLIRVFSGWALSMGYSGTQQSSLRLLPGRWGCRWLSARAAACCGRKSSVQQRLGHSEV